MSQQQLMSYLPIVLIVIAFYFLIIRPQQQRIRKQKDLIASITVGDEVLTYSGMYAVVVSLGDRTRVRVADGTELEIDPNAVADIVTKGGVTEER